MNALPGPPCSTDCSTVQTVQVPGTAGGPGGAGADGSNGLSAITTLTAAFAMPAELGTVTITVGQSAWAAVDQIVFVQNAGFMQVTALPTSTTLTVKNLKDTPNSAYIGTYPAGNVAPTTNVAGGNSVVPCGIQGVSGALTGAAGNDLEGTYPNPRVKITTTKGDLIVNNNAGVAPRNTRLGVGANGTVLHSDSAQATGLIHRAVDVSGVNTVLSGALAIGNGGTGQVTKTPAFNALSPITTRGDLITRDATNNVRLAIGANNTVLTSNGTDPAWAGVTAAMMAASAKFLGRYGLLGFLTGVNANLAGDTVITMASTRYRVDRIIVENASISLTTATGGVFNTAGGIGTIAADQALAALTASGKFLSLTISGVGSTDLQVGNLFFRIGTPQGAAATASVWVFGHDVNP